MSATSQPKRGLSATGVRRCAANVSQRRRRAHVLPLSRGRKHDGLRSMRTCTRSCLPSLGEFRSTGYTVAVLGSRACVSAERCTVFRSGLRVVGIEPEPVIPILTRHWPTATGRALGRELRTPTRSPSVLFTLLHGYRGNGRPVSHLPRPGSAIAREDVRCRLSHGTVRARVALAHIGDAKRPCQLSAGTTRQASLERCGAQFFAMRPIALAD